MANDKIELLLKSTAVVIDDEIEKTDSQIVQIVNDLTDLGTLFVKLNSIPDEISSFINVSYILLDWKFTDEPLTLPNGVSLGEEYKKYNNPITFIEKIINKFYIPILVFSTEDTSFIKNQLSKSVEIKHSIETGRIGIFNKSNVLSSNVKEYLTGWMDNNISAHLFKHLDNVISKTKHKFFNEFDQCNKDWPSHVYYTLEKDSPVDIDSEFQEFILTAFTSRIETKKFDGAFTRGCSLSPEDILKIYSSIKYVSYKNEQPSGAHCGDLYCKLDSVGNPTDDFFINITAPCDLRCSEWLIVKGVAEQHKDLSNTKIDRIHKTNDNFHIIFQIADKDLIKIDLKTYARIKPNGLDSVELSDDGIKCLWKRVGRLLSPDITYLQDHFSRFIIRRGLTRTPPYTSPADGKVDKQ